MARARNIKPGFYTNEDLAECSVWARYIFPGLWMMADREGRLEYRPKKIKGELLRYDNVDAEPLLLELERFGFIRIYEANGAKYIYVVTFHKHQNPHHRETASVFPPPPGVSNAYNHLPITAEQRERILDRDGRQCVDCGSTDDLEIDHVVARANGGSSEDGNLQCLCSACNVRKGKKEPPRHGNADLPSGDKPNLGREDATYQGGQAGLIPDSGFLIPDSLNPEAAHVVVLSPQGEEKSDALPEFPSSLSSEQKAAVPLVVKLRALGVTITSANPLAAEWLAKGLTVDRADEAVEFARLKGKPSGPIHPNFLNALIDDILKPKAPKKRADDWYRTNPGIERKASELGILCPPGKSHDWLRERCESEIRKREQGVAA